MKDCKYRLPCLWCDKHDRLCDLVKLELHEIEYNNESAHSESLELCEHNWKYVATDIGNAATHEFHRCTKCGEIQKFEVKGL